MEWRRLNFFVEDCQVSGDGWQVSGEEGNGPIQGGDVLSFTYHTGSGDEDDVRLHVQACEVGRLRLTGFGGELIRPGDILGGDRGVEP